MPLTRSSGSGFEVGNAAGGVQRVHLALVCVRTMDADSRPRVTRCWQGTDVEAIGTAVTGAGLKESGTGFRRWGAPRGLREAKHPLAIAVLWRLSLRTTLHALRQRV